MFIIGAAVKTGKDPKRNGPGNARPREEAIVTTLGIREGTIESSRADILAAAARSFMDRGYQATSLDEIARSMGATKGRIYHHFPSKADLFAEVFRAGMDMNYAALEPARQAAGAPGERWRRMAAIHVNQMIETQPFQRAVWMGVEMHLRGATTPEQRTVFSELLDYRKAYGGIFRAEVEAGREAGEFDFEDPSIAAQLMFMTLNSPIFWYKPREGESQAQRQDIVGQVVTCAWRGLGGKGA